MEKAEEIQQIEIDPTPAYKFNRILARSVLIDKDEAGLKKKYGELLKEQKKNTTLAGWIAVSHRFGAIFLTFGPSTFLLLYLRVGIAFIPVKSVPAIIEKNSPARFEYGADAIQICDQVDPADPASSFIDGIYLSPCELMLAVVDSNCRHLSVLRTKDIMGQEHPDIVLSLDYASHGGIKQIEWANIRDPHEGNEPCLLLVFLDGTMLVRYISEREETAKGLKVECASFSRDAAHILAVPQGLAQVHVLSRNSLAHEKTIDLPVLHGARVFFIKEAAEDLTLYGAMGKRKVDDEEQDFEEVFFHQGPSLADPSVAAVKAVKKYGFFTPSPEDPGPGQYLVAEVPQANTIFLASTKYYTVEMIFKDPTRPADGYKVVSIENLSCESEEGDTYVRGLGVFDCLLPGFEDRTINEELEGEKKTLKWPPTLIMCTSFGDLRSYQYLCCKFEGRSLLNPITDISVVKDSHIGSALKRDLSLSISRSENRHSPALPQPPPAPGAFKRTAHLEIPPPESSESRHSSEEEEKAKPPEAPRPRSPPKEEKKPTAPFADVFAKPPQSLFQPSQPQPPPLLFRPETKPREEPTTMFSMTKPVELAKKAVLEPAAAISPKRTAFGAIGKQEPEVRRSPERQMIPEEPKEAGEDAMTEGALLSRIHKIIATITDCCNDYIAKCQSTIRNFRESRNPKVLNLGQTLARQSEEIKRLKKETREFEGEIVELQKKAAYLSDNQLGRLVQMKDILLGDNKSWNKAMQHVQTVDSGLLSGYKQLHKRGRLLQKQLEELKAVSSRIDEVTSACNGDKVRRLVVHRHPLTEEEQKERMRKYLGAYSSVAATSSANASGSSRKSSSQSQSAIKSPAEIQKKLENVFETRLAAAIKELAELKKSAASSKEDVRAAEGRSAASQGKRGIRFDLVDEIGSEDAEDDLEEYSIHDICVKRAEAKKACEDLKSAFEAQRIATKMVTVSAEAQGHEFAEAEGEIRELLRNPIEQQSPAEDESENPGSEDDEEDDESIKDTSLSKTKKALLMLSSSKKGSEMPWGSGIPSEVTIKESPAKSSPGKKPAGEAREVKPFPETGPEPFKPSVMSLPPKAPSSGPFFQPKPAANADHGNNNKKQTDMFGGFKIDAAAPEQKTQAPSMFTSAKPSNEEKKQAEIKKESAKQGLFGPSQLTGGIFAPTKPDEQKTEPKSGEEKREPFLLAPQFAPAQREGKKEAKKEAAPASSQPVFGPSSFFAPAQKEEKKEEKSEEKKEEKKDEKKEEKKVQSGFFGPGLFSAPAVSAESAPKLATTTSQSEPVDGAPAAEARQKQKEDSHVSAAPSAGGLFQPSVFAAHPPASGTNIFGAPGAGQSLGIFGPKPAAASPFGAPSASAAPSSTGLFMSAARPAAPLFANPATSLPATSVPIPGGPAAGPASFFGGPIVAPMIQQPRPLGAQTGHVFGAGFMSGPAQSQPQAPAPASTAFLCSGSAAMVSADREDEYFGSGAPSAFGAVARPPAGGMFGAPSQPFGSFQPAAGGAFGMTQPTQNQGFGNFAGGFGMASSAPTADAASRYARKEFSQARK